MRMAVGESVGEAVTVDVAGCVKKKNWLWHGEL